MIQETGPNHPTSLYIYTDQNSYEPLARIDTDGNQEQHIRYFHTDLNGCPEELTDANGEILWECSFQLWGKRIHEIEHESVEQNLRYQGQYLDRETGLHYNTFRYYDPDIGRFTQPDPIGLLGGFNLYQYAPNGLTWVDPWGWSCTPNKINLTKAGVKHVKNRHVGNKIGWEHKSKWTLNNAEMKSTVRNVFRKPDRIIKDGDRFIYEKTMPNKIVGVTPEGTNLNKARVVVESNGDLVTAFPQEVFKDMKVTDILIFSKQR
ncbi:hypothetical protein BGI32_03745 [Snodgrassella alvi]|uniref:RHS protein conserved region domain-containing protein n=1 Tax=Snodgrassella alvi TaxID=1196083 RepID=A0A2N9WV43_9NEIS|nr:RHS repeat-associated core domain-containing protein [Snodgrassella alvi]PIT16810.1 hypothetical protein BGI32_03745 [Snodgrassella alvi]